MINLGKKKTNFLIFKSVRFLRNGFSSISIIWPIFCGVIQWFSAVKSFRNKVDIDLPRVYCYKEIRWALCSVKATQWFSRSLYCTRISCNKRANYQSDGTNPIVFPSFEELHSLSWPCHCYQHDRYYCNCARLLPINSSLRHIVFG